MAWTHPSSGPVTQPLFYFPAFTLWLIMVRACLCSPHMTKQRLLRLPSYWAGCVLVWETSSHNSKYSNAPESISCCELRLQIGKIWSSSVTAHCHDVVFVSQQHVWTSGHVMSSNVEFVGWNGICRWECSQELDKRETFSSAWGLMVAGGEIFATKSANTYST